MNKVHLIGRLVRDPEIRLSSSDPHTSVGRYTLAVDRRIHKEGDASADFITCVIFGRLAEFAQRYLHQGIKLAVSGRLQTRSYDGREGQRIYVTEVIVDEQEFAESKSISDSRNHNRNSSAVPSADLTKTANDPSAAAPAAETAVPAQASAQLPSPAQTPVSSQAPTPPTPFPAPVSGENAGPLPVLPEEMDDNLPFK